MTDTLLNKQEFEEFQKRGFFIKKNYSVMDLVQSLGNIVLYSCLIIIFLVFFLSFCTFFLWLLLTLLFPLLESYTIFSYSITLIATIFVTIIGLLPCLNFIYSYFSSGITFYTENGMIEHGKFNGRNPDGLFFIDKILHNYMISGDGGVRGFSMGLLLTSMASIFLIGSDKISFMSIYSGNNPIVLIILNELLAVFLLGITLLLLTIILLSGRYFFQSFHPLYAFGNLGEKIQSLTPQITSQSKLIESEFKKDMNFSILHTGFEKLSSIFSQIISLVLNLEQVEKRANKGNLFDSTKYINSLRSDIITPLTSLRKFLEKQKQELLTSQNELTRVRVGGSDETGNIDLASKRSESLFRELDENIVKLDEMIGKMSQ